MNFQNGVSSAGQVVADADNDTLTVIGGPGVNFTVDGNSDAVTISLQSAEEIVASAIGRVELRADDSTVRIVQGGESFGILGDGGVASTASNAEGDITINVDTDLSNYNNTTTAFISNINNESIDDLNDVTLSAIADGELLQYSSGQFINRTITEAGFATVSTTGSYSDLSSRPNITFDGDMSGSTGGALGGGASTITLTLDNVNSNIGTFNTVTVNAKGLVTSASNVNFATVATTGSYNDLTDLPSLAGTYKFNIAADDSTVESINSQETVQIVGGTNITTSLTDGVITITGPSKISEFTNDVGYITVDQVPQTFGFKVGADDSTARNIGNGEQFNIYGGTAITTTSDAEGNITITGVAQDFSWGSITGTPTTLAGYGITDAATSAQGALADSALQSGDNVSTLVNDAGYITNADIFKFSVGADDSTLREITKDESIKFIGAQNITTASDAEGNITITGPDLTAYGQTLNTAGNTGTGSVGLTSETFTVLGVTGQVKVDASAFVLSIGLENLINTDLKGSVFGDDSTLLVDGVSGKIPSANIAGTEATNWNTAYGWGNHATAGYASTGYVDTAVSNLVDSAPGTLDTLNELAAALNDDANFASTITNRFTNIENNMFAIGADDSTLRTVKQGEGIKIIGGTNLTTTSDAEGNITVDFVNPGYITAGLQSGDNVSELVNDAGYFTRLFVAGDDSTVRTLVKDETIQFQGTGSTTTSTDADGNVIIDSGNETITLFGDVTGSGTTSINVTLKDSPIAAGTYNSITFDTKGIAQSGSLVDYLIDGDNISRLNNDAGYITDASAVNFNIVGDDSSGFNMQNQGTFQFTGTGGITVVAATDATTPTVTIDGSAFVEVGEGVSTLNNDAGYYKAGSAMVGDLTGSVFSESSTRVIDGQTGNLYGQLTGNVIGDLKGSVVADDSTVIIDGVAGTVATTALDTYVESSYTPTVTGSTGGTATVNATANKLSYTKIGRMVHVQGSLDVTSVAGCTGNLQITLPYASMANDNGTGYTASVVGTYNVDIAGSNIGIYIQIDPSSSNALMWAQVDNGVSVAQLNTGIYRFNFTYTV